MLAMLVVLFLGCGDDSTTDAARADGSTSDGGESVPQCTAPFGQPFCTDTPDGAERLPLCPGETLICDMGTARPESGMLLARCSSGNLRCEGSDAIPTCTRVPDCL
jgi:hypothetical protein